MLKKSILFLTLFICGFLLCGCSSYSEETLNPLDKKQQVIASSEPEAKVYLSNLANEVIKTTASFDAQLVRLQESLSSTSQNDIDYLIREISIASKIAEQKVTYLENYKPVAVLEQKKENLLKTVKAYKDILDNLKNTIESGNFTNFKDTYNTYINCISALQAASNI